jgi:segregation and condensation protein A
MFQVSLTNYRGPLDLLLYLVRKHELETSALSLAAITNQFIDYLAALKEIDLTPVGEFVEIASTLLEIKSRVALPHAEEEEEVVDANREDLVARLLEYKQYRDAASLLEDRAHEAQQRFGRIADDLTHSDPDLASQPIHEVELWDLVGAMSRLIRDANISRGASIVYDETPIHVFMERIHERLLKEESFALSDLFAAKMHKSTMISTFLALLELVRHHHVSTDQGDAYGEVWIHRGPGFEAENTPDFSTLDSAAIATTEELGSRNSPPALENA